MGFQMGLNIKNERVHELARILAQSTGRSMTAVIEEALEEKLSRLEREREMPGRVAWLEQRLQELGPPSPGITSDHSDLYDEDGLPA
jgi:antitoxin VapB